MAALIKSAVIRMTLNRILMVARISNLLRSVGLDLLYQIAIIAVMESDLKQAKDLPLAEPLQILLR